MNDNTLLIEQLKVVRDELSGKRRAPMRAVIDEAIRKIIQLDNEHTAYKEANP